MNQTTTPLTVTLPGDLTGVDGAARIFELLLAESGGTEGRVQMRRVVREAAAASPGDIAQLWWRWIAEAGTNLGLKCKVVDCTPAEFNQLARQGARLVVYVAGDDPWRVVLRSAGRKFRMACASEDRGPYWGDAGRLAKLLGSPAKGSIVRCVLVEPSLAYGEMASVQTEEMTPLARLFALLRPERADVFILVVFSLVVGLLSLATPLAVDALVTTVAFGRLLQPLVLLALLLFAFLAFSAALRALKTYVVEIIQCRLFARVAADLAYRIPRIRVASVDGRYLPELLNRFFDVVTVQKVTAGLLLDGLQLSLNALVGLAVLAFYHPWLLGFDVVLLAMLSFAIFILGRGAVASSIKESKSKYKMADWLEDLSRCSVTFKLAGGAEYALARGDQLIHEYLVARKGHFRVLMRQVVFTLGLQAVASAVLLGIGGWLVMNGQLTLGQLVAAELIVTVVVGSFAKLGKSMEGFYDLMAAVDKLGVLFDLPIEEQEGVLHQFPQQPASLRVRGLKHRSPQHELVEPSTFEIRGGERVGLVGPGSRGLMEVAFGLRQPSGGHLMVDGIDIRDLRPDFLRRRAALVRGPEVFHGSIAENVHLGRPEITANAVRDALELVGLLESILRLPDGLSTELSNDGAPLNELQLRRLTLARAAAGRPGLLFVDGLLDCFSDEEAEELLQMLSDSRQPWTLLLATNRTRLFDYCGRVVEVGSRETVAVNGEGEVAT